MEKKHKYIASVVSTLPSEQREKILENLADKPELMDGMTKHFVPFEVIKALPTGLVLEMIESRPDPQIAKLVFAADETIRSAILKPLPEIRRLTVEDEIKILDADTFYAKRYKKQSMQLQHEVSKLLISLNNEGLLEIGTQNSEEGTTAEETSEAAA